SRPVALAGVLPAPDEGVELDRSLADRLDLACRRDEQGRAARCVERSVVAAHEVGRVGPRELLPRQPSVASGRTELVAEHRDRPLAVGVDEGERAPLPLRPDDGAPQRFTAMMDAVTVPPFERFYEAWSGEILAFLRRRLGAVDAEDAFQETFLRALRGYDRLEHGRELRAWAYTIAARVVADVHR